MPGRTRQKRDWEADREVGEGSKHRGVRRQSTKSRWLRFPRLGLSFGRKLSIKAYKMCMAHSKSLTNANYY